jgi:dihydroflavonol-4-reductase
MTHPITSFVTGATGFVGAAVARVLSAQGHSLRLLARAGSDRRNLQGLDNIEIVEGDLTKPQTYAEALKGCDALFHVAADYRIWVRDPGQMHQINVDGTRMLMEAALMAEVPKVVYTSSVATLGIHKDGTPSDETTPVSLSDMVGVYKKSKFLAEQEVKRLIKQQGLPCVIVNPSTPIGPRDIRPTPTGRIIVEAAKGHMPAYVDTGLNVVHVDDVAEGHFLAYQNGKIGDRYILGGEDMSLGEILGFIAGQVGRKAPVVKIPQSLLFPLAYVAEAIARRTGKEPFATVDGLKMSRKKMYFSHQKATDDLGYRPRPATAALVDAIKWFKENGYI